MGKVIAKTGIKKKKGYLYYVDKNGNVAESRMAQYDDGSRHHSPTMDGLQGKAAAKKRVDIEVYKTANGTRLETRINDRLYKQLYMGYTLAEAKRRFRAYVNEAAYGISGPEKAKPAKKKATPKKASAKKAAPKKAAPKRKYKTGLIMVRQSPQGIMMDVLLKAKSPGRRVSASGRKYNERRSNRAD